MRTLLRQVAPWRKACLRVHNSSLASAAAAVQNGSTSCAELVAECRDAARRHAGLNAFITQTWDDAASAAEEADQRRAQGGARSAIDGLPIAVKDNFCTAGVRTTAASRVLAEFVAPYDASPVSRLRAAGASLVGKANMDEFGMGSAGAHSYFGPTMNAEGNGLVPGGSSSGSAVAVQSGACLAALGSDTGGSVRMPASYCGLVGLKPSYGRIPRHGLIAYASSLDTPGVLTRTVADAALLLALLAGPDGHDSSCIQDRYRPVEFADSARGIVDAVKGMSVAVPREYQVAEMDAGVSACWQDCAAALEGAGASVHLQSLPTTVDAVAAYYVIAPAEASSNLSRYDSVRYGHRADRDAAAAVATRRGAGEADFHDLVTASRSAGFGEEVQRRILAGTYALSAEAYGAYYGQAVRVRVAVRADFARLFESGVDVVLVPSTPTPAYPMEHLTGAAGSGGGDSGDDPAAPDDAEFLNDLMTIPANLAGLPAISVPAGRVPTPWGDLPCGMQLIGRPGDEATLLRAAAALEALIQEH